MNTDCGRHELSRLMRPSWAEIDLPALDHNLARARALVGQGVKIYLVVKGDGFGIGAAALARRAEAAGIDGFCAGSPDEVAALRSTGTRLPVLLFASTSPQDLRRAAGLGATVTVESPEDLEALLGSREPIEVFVEIDAGLARFGFGPGEWPEAFRRLAAAPQIAVRGIYAHFTGIGDECAIARQCAIYAAATADADAAGLRGYAKMVSSSRSMIAHRGLDFDMVDPGRFILGALDGEWMDKGGLRPCLSAVKGRIIRIHDYSDGDELGIGYAAPIKVTGRRRTAVVPIGFWDGLGHAPPLGEVLVRGHRCSVLGRRTFQHSIIDVTDVADVAIDDEVVIMGRQGEAYISIDELAAATGTLVMELVPRLLRALPHVYI